jgi:hypothetical protein
VEQGPLVSLPAEEILEVMAEFDEKEMVLLYNPAAGHHCNLPILRMSAGNRILSYTIMECDECAQRWWAYVSHTDHTLNKWNKLRWYHFDLRRKIG